MTQIKIVDLDELQVDSKEKPVFLTFKDNKLTLASRGDQLMSFRTKKDGSIEFYPAKNNQNVAARITEGFVIIAVENGMYIDED